MSTLTHLGYVLAFGASSIACLWAALHTRKLDNRQVRNPLFAFLLFTAVWSASSMFLLFPLSLTTMTVFYFIGLVTGLSTVVTWLWFCSAYSGHTYHLNPRLRAIVLTSFMLLILVKVTNPIHGKYYTPKIESNPFVHFSPSVGIVYWIVAAIAYISSAVGMFLLFDSFIRTETNTTKISILTVVIGLPVVPKLITTVNPDALLLLFYEPIGAAVFAVGVLTVAKDDFASVQMPAQNQVSDIVNDLIIIVDNKENIVQYNKQAKQLLNLTADNIGKPVQEVIPELPCMGKPSSTMRKETANQIQYYTVDITDITLGEESVGKSYVFSDVTEVEIQRQRLEQQQTHADNLTEAMAHELRNPLGIITGRLEQMQTTAITGPHMDSAMIDPKEIEPMVDSAMSASERIDAVLNDLIRIIDKGKPITEVNPHSLRTLVQQAWNETTHNSTDIDCTVDATIIAEKARSIDLFQHIFSVHTQRDATKIQVSLNEDTLYISSDARSFQLENTERLFEYGVETQENVRLLLANARTFATLHGWDIYIDTHQHKLRIAISDIKVDNHCPSKLPE